MNDIKTIAVYAASSSKIDPHYINEAYRLGECLALNQISLVCGAGSQGLMRAVTDGAIDNEGHVTGIIPQFMIDNGWCYDKLSEVIATDNMHTRKETMAKMADAVIALPGGCGTLEELLEIITWRQLGLFDGNIIIFNINGFYNPILQMLQNCINQGFMDSSHASIWKIVNTVDEVFETLKTTNQITLESKY